MVRTKTTKRCGAAMAVLLGAATLCGAARAEDATGAQAGPPGQQGAQGPQARDVLDELVVDLSDRATDEDVARLEARYGASFLPVSNYVSHDRIYRVRTGATGKGVLQRLLTALRGEGQVEAADVQTLFFIPEIAPTALTVSADEALTAPAGRVADGETFPNDPKYKYQWHLVQLHMPQAWRRGQGKGVVVAVVDTGVTPVEDLRANDFVPGYNFVDNSDDARDDHGHGTHVAGTIAQTTHNGIGVAGVAYRARIMPIKVLSGQGSGTVGGIADGIRWAVDHGAQVLNMSLGGRFNSQVLANAVKYAAERGVVVVCAAGNDGRNKVSYPAANAGAIAVAATQFDEGTTFYSNWGREIAVAAPGGNTRLDQNGDGVPDGVMQHTVTPGNIEKEDYLLFMGTSMASPHVAGVAALLVGAGVTDPARVAKILKDTARKPSQYRGRLDEHYGAGIVDADAALKAAQQGRGHEQLAVTAGLSGLLLLALRRRLRLGMAGWLAAALWAGGASLVAAPWAGVVGGAGGAAVGLLGASVPALSGVVFSHGNPLIYSALLPLVLTVLLYGARSLRGLLAGICLGQAGVLLYTLLGSGTLLSYLPGWAAAPWLLLHGLVCLGLAALVAYRPAR